MKLSVLFREVRLVNVPVGWLIYYRTRSIELFNTNPMVPFFFKLFLLPCASFEFVRHLKSRSQSVLSSHSISSKY